MLLSLRVIREALHEVLPMGWSTVVDHFRRDINPKAELFLWLAITGTYLTVLNEYELTYDERKELFRIVFISTRSPRGWKLPDDSPGWERRALELATFAGDFTDNAFSSQSVDSDA
jgi:hypothetical protein